MTRYDLVTLGETMIRLSPPAPQRLEQAAVLEINIGGAESNLAVAMARLGFKAAWLSRLPENAWGRRIVETLRAQNVDVSGVTWARGERVGTYFVEYGRAPRPIQVLYDRADSAMSRMSSADVRWELLEGARIAHCTGITPALGESCARVTEEFMRRAKAEGACVSFDVNYRALLWSPAQAAEALDKYCRLADIVFVGWRDLATVFGAQGNPEQAAPLWRERWGCRTLVITLGEAGALGCEAQEIAQALAYQVEVVDRLGAGDAFDAGFLAARLGGRSLGDCLRYGAALSALCMTIPSDLALVTAEEVELLLASGGASIRR
jgi:2-dehydro-3-deoxygluconokinase